MPSIDPFLMLDYFDSPNAQRLRRRLSAHPHRGFETVTYMLDGRMRHRDNHGGEGVIEPGGIQWMTAGRASCTPRCPNRPRDDARLPALGEPAGEAEDDRAGVPGARRGEDADRGARRWRARQGDRRRDLGGTARASYRGGESRAVTSTSSCRRTEIRRSSRADRAAFVVAHEGASRSTTEGSGEPSALRSSVRATPLGSGRNRPARALFIAGKPLNEPVVWHGPFVMNTQEELLQAIDDYQAGRF